MSGPASLPVDSQPCDSSARDVTVGVPSLVPTSTATQDGASSSTAQPVDTASTAGPGLVSLGSPTSRSRIYSPSETADWLQCPVYRQFRKRWQPRSVEWSPAILLGSAVQAGLFLWLRQGTQVNESAIEGAVIQVLEQGYTEDEKYTLPGLVKLSLRGVQTVMESDHFTRHAILSVDEPLGHSRPDVVSRHETEGLGVTDFKVSHHVDERYRKLRMSAFDTDDQFWHYAWEVTETLGEPVKWLRPMLIILSPKPQVLTELVRVTPERLHFWLQGAEQHWLDMSQEDAGERPVAPRWPACRGGRYGICEAYDGCHLLGGDESRYNTYYERRER